MRNEESGIEMTRLRRGGDVPPVPPFPFSLFPVPSSLKKFCAGIAFHFNLCYNTVKFEYKGGIPFFTERM